MVVNGVEGEDGGIVIVTYAYRMAIVEDCTVLTRATDARVPAESATTVVVYLVLEDALELVFHHSWLAALQHLHMRFTNFKIRTDED